MKSILALIMEIILIGITALAVAFLYSFYTKQALFHIPFKFLLGGTGVLYLLRLSIMALMPGGTRKIGYRRMKADRHIKLFNKEKEGITVWKWVLGFGLLTIIFLISYQCVSKKNLMPFGPPLNQSSFDPTGG